MQNANIGYTAGKLWEVIGKQKKVNLAKLGSTARIDEDLALLALGWLAREGKVKIEESGRVTNVTLTESEQAAYNKNSAVAATPAKARGKEASAGA